MHLQFFFFNDTATTEIYTLSLHDALPISNAPFEGSPVTETAYPLRAAAARVPRVTEPVVSVVVVGHSVRDEDRKSTRLNSSHANISYAVFCLKKKKNTLLHLSHSNLTSSV